MTDQGDCSDSAVQHFEILLAPVDKLNLSDVVLQKSDLDSHPEVDGLTAIWY